MRVLDTSSDLMVVAEGHESLAEVASRMRFNDVGSAVVNDKGRIVGIVTERDLARAVADGIDPAWTTVADYMTPDPVVVTSDVDVVEAARIMLATGVRHLPVATEGVLVGLVSLRDLIQQLIY